MNKKNQFLNKNQVPRNSTEVFYSHPCLTFHELSYNNTPGKHDIEYKWPNIQVQNKSTSVERY